MKKVVLLIIVSVFVFSACIMIRTPIQGFLVTNATVNGPELNEPMLSGKMVEGTATAEGILGVVWGDCSYETALQDALKKSGASSLKHIVVDTKVKYILGIYCEYTTIVRGVAVR
jgi:hypothetical protein